MTRFLFATLFLSFGCLVAKPLTHEELNFVNKHAYRVSKKEGKLGHLEEKLFRVYLAQAQVSFAELSGYQGTFLPITQEMITLFYPEALVSEFEDKPVDENSRLIANSIARSLSLRLTKEGDSLKTAREYQKNMPENFLYGAAIPWYLSSAQEFCCPPPSLDRVTLLEQMSVLKKAVGQLDAKKIAAMDYWANLADWEKISEQYMKRQNTPLEIRLKVKAKLLSALMDAEIATYTEKYTHFAPQPRQVDPTFFPVIEETLSPSYPSLVSVESKVAAVVLGAYFPENKQKWDNLAEEAGQTRVWSGVQFPQDHVAGKKLGSQIGNKALSK